MDLIPVIDLADGVVVHARGGQRRTYQPLKSRLCESSTPFEVVDALQNLYPFTDLYIADLDAIDGRSAQVSTLQSLRHSFPRLHFWLDAGIRDSRTHAVIAGIQGVTTVLGSETLGDDCAFLTSLPKDSTVLSLDFQHAALLGPDCLTDSPSAWPNRVIAMCLDRVGSHHGPAFERINQLIRTSAATAIYAAGGIRDERDLRRLRELGCAGVLMATALHDGTFTASTLRSLA